MLKEREIIKRIPRSGVKYVRCIFNISIHASEGVISQYFSHRLWSFEAIYIAIDK
jgi:hypothetical protein